MSINSIVAAMAVVVAAPAFAQPYEISWWTVDGGGGTSTGGVFTLSGTIGQPDAGVLSGGIYTLSGGFWAGASSSASCPADFNGDGAVDFFDYDDFVSCFEGGACPPGKTADFNQDGAVDFFDYDDFVAAFEAGC